MPPAAYRLYIAAQGRPIVEKATDIKSDWASLGLLGMSIYLRLDDSLIQVAPTLDDVEPILMVRTRFRTFNEDGADGIVRKVSNKNGRSTRTNMPCMEASPGEAAYETRISANDSKSTEYETQTLYRAGGAGQVFWASDRRIRFSARWYGNDNRYLELRLRVRPGAEVIANKGMANLNSGEFNFMGAIKNGSWVEIHYDNHTHVGMSMSIHPAEDDFSIWAKKLRSADPTGLAPSRFARILDNDE